MTVSRDQTSRVALPLTAAEWTECLDGTGLANPSSFWLCSQASGSSLADLGTAARAITINGSPVLGATAVGFSATGIRCTDNGAQYLTATIPDVATTSGLLLQILAIETNPAADRVIGTIGTNDFSAARLANGTNHAKLKGTVVGNSSTGDQQYPNTLVVVTKLNRASSVFGVYTRGERIKPTYANPATSTTLEMMGHLGGNAVGGVLIYAAYWSGADAEISDSQVQNLINSMYGDATTLSVMQEGSVSGKLVVAIEGCKYLLCESHPDSAIAAWAGSDWTTALPGLFVDLKNRHTLQVWEPFTGGGSCKLSIVDTDGADTFGIFVNRRAGSAETEITATLDRNDTTLAVAATQDFTSSGEVYIGTECIGYTGKTGTTFTGCTRGKYSPFGCGTSGSGGRRFANHHRVGQDVNHVQMRPVVSELPRVWVGKRVGVWLHTWDAETETMNPRDEAQLLFAGRIAGIADNPSGPATEITLEPIHEEIKNAVIGKDMWAATLADGITLVEGRVFKFTDGKQGSTDRNANNLECIVGASGTNQIEPGRYTLETLCEKINAWLAGERSASRIYGTYSFASPVTSNVGLRTKCYWRIEDASSTIDGYFAIQMPGEVCSFLGLKDAEPGTTGVTENWNKRRRTNQDHIAQGDAVPFTNLIFKPSGPGRLSQEFSEVMTYLANDERGTFVDQYEYLPANIKNASDDSVEWGLFLLNDEVLMVGSYDTGTLTKCWLAPFQLTAGTAADAVGYIGRRVDEPEAGPITLRQVFVLEATFAELMATFIYNTGTSGYNHSTDDSLGYGLGAGIPGETLGGSFERSLTNMPGANAPIAVIIDEPTKLEDLLSADLLLRRTFLRWKDESFEFCQWKTPLAANAVADLTESTKAAPAGSEEDHRVATVENNDQARPIVKFDYCRDFAVGRDGQYLKSVMVEDASAVDDLGGNVKPFTLKLRNTYGDMANTGSAIEALLPEYITMFPVTARPMKQITRSIDPRFFEGYGVGDVVTISDEFARDPNTGIRSITSRAGMITRLSYDIGGSSVDGSTRDIAGDIDLMFLDTQRGEIYAPSAQVDDTAANAGYNVGTKTLTCYAEKFSHNITITVNWGTHTKSIDITEDADATHFDAGDKVFVYELDTTSGLTWEDTVVSQTGNTITLTTGLAGWDAAKKYCVTYQRISQVQASQLEVVYQADATDKLAEDEEVAWHYSATDEPSGFVELGFL
jgi:hypothetical protein